MATFSGNDVLRGGDFHDRDGNGVVAKVQFALIGVDTHAALTAANFLVT